MRQLLPPTDQGVEVDLDAAYAYPTGLATPFVRANMVASADGAASLDGRSGTLSGPPDKRIFRMLRGLADVVLVGAATVRQEQYGPARLSAERQAWRAERGLAEVPPIAVVTRGLDLDFDSPFFTEAVTRPLVLTAAGAPAGRRRAAERVADVVVAGEFEVTPGAIAAVLAERELLRVLCEGGPHWLGVLASAGMLNELCLTVSPRLAGGDGGRIVRDLRLDAAVDLSLASLFEEDGFLFCRYTL